MLSVTGPFGLFKGSMFWGPGHNVGKSVNDISTKEATHTRENIPYLFLPFALCHFGHHKSERDTLGRINYLSVLIAPFSPPNSPNHQRANCSLCLWGRNSQFIRVSACKLSGAVGSRDHYRILFIPARKRSSCYTTLFPFDYRPYGVYSVFTVEVLQMLLYKKFTKE